MPTHRFRELLLPSTRSNSLPVHGFIAFPMMALPGWSGQAFPVQELYRLAFEEAKAVTRPAAQLFPWGDLRN